MTAKNSHADQLLGNNPLTNQTSFLETVIPRPLGGALSLEALNCIRREIQRTHQTDRNVPAKGAAFPRTLMLSSHRWLYPHHGAHVLSFPPSPDLVSTTLLAGRLSIRNHNMSLDPPSSHSWRSSFFLSFFLFNSFPGGGESRYLPLLPTRCKPYSRWMIANCNI